ncbi:MAG: type III-A CRISPR-associated protein Csm2 [Sphaerochaeta sp.]
MLPLTESLLTEEPKKLVNELFNKGKMKKDVSASQMRRFYDDFLLLQKKANGLNEEEFNKQILPLIRFSKAKMAYNVGREVLPIEFMQGIEPYINMVACKNDFDTFLLFYQALIGYTKFEEFEQKNRRYQPQKNYGGR